MKTTTYDDLLKLYDNKIIMVDESTIVDVIYDWCDEQNIRAGYIGRLEYNCIWYIENDDDRLLFCLRWQ